MSNLKDILSRFSGEIDQEILIKYLQGQLTEEQKHEVEKKMLDSNFHDDALEGLQEIRNKEKLALLVDQMNRDLKRKLEKKKFRREKFRIKDQPWIYIAIIIILLLIVLSYVVIHRMMQNP